MDKLDNKRTQSTWLSYFSILTIFCCAFSYFSYVSADPDLWGHIKFGADHWIDGKLAEKDPYSFTAEGHRWINHEWLSEIIFYLTYQIFGSAGLLIGKLTIGLCMTAMIIKICGMRYRDPLILVIVLILASFVARKGFMIRPQLFSFLFFSVFLYLFHLFFEKQKNRLYLIPIIMVLWVNLHGGFLMGWALVMGVVGWKTLEKLIRGKQVDQLGMLWMWALLTSLSTLLNPYGINLLIFLYESLSVPRQITEWAPIPLMDISFIRLKLTALLFLIVLLSSSRKAIGWESAAITAIMLASFRQQRHSPFFAIAAAPFLVYWLSIVLDRIRHRYPTIRLSQNSIIAIMVVLCIVSSYQIVKGGYRYIAGRLNIIVDLNEYPVGAVKYLKANHLRGNVILPFTWGEYAIWHLYPSCRVSIDGRFRTAYPESIIRDHFIHKNDGDAWSRLIKKYPADILLVRQSRFFNNMIHKSDEWVYVYSDPTAIVFLRKNSVNDSFINRFKTEGPHIVKATLSPFFP